MQQKKADSTLRSSRAVPHPSTNRALRRLTSEVRRDPVHSTRYGRQRNQLRASLAWVYGVNLSFGKDFALLLQAGLNNCGFLKNS